MAARHDGKAPIVPTIAERVWAFFWTLDARRPADMNGHAVIAHSEIEACARLHGARLKPWELRALDGMERERLRWLNAPKDTAPADKPVMTTAMFKAMFGVGKGAAA